jgi:type IV pilus assembly protein PilE
MTKSMTAGRAVRSGGFTLIELMIVVAIIAILAGIGYPSYTSYVTRASREAAKSELLQLQNLQEKIYLNSSGYAVSVTTAYNGRSDGGLGVTSGRTSDNKYTISISPTSGTAVQTYTLTATPVAGKSQAGDGNITAASNGTRTWGSTTW